MYNDRRDPDFLSALRLRRRPQAAASLLGARTYASVQGTVRFYQTESGVLVVTEVVGLPRSQSSRGCDSPMFGFHIHEGDRCSGTAEDPYADAAAHYNPWSCPHPYHAGDLPPLFGCDGTAFSVTLTDRFRAEEVIGRTVILHAMPDEFMTQPSGNSGAKIACGIIRG